MILFVVFLLLGVIIGQFPLLAEFLSANQDNSQIEEQTPAPTIETQTQKKGKVVYVNPSLRPSENVSYKLLDSEGKDIIFLEAGDDKLKFVEGATVTLKGKIQKLQNTKYDVLFVEQVVYN